MSDAEIAALKARPENAVDRIAGRWVRLRRKGKGFVGPCPIHSPDPNARDSTSFECDSDSWVCAVCSDGGDVIKLVMRREEIDFRAAVDYLGGSRGIDPEEARRAEEWRHRRQAAREREHDAWRERERGRAWDILQHGQPIAGTPVEQYLRLARGLDYPADVRLRFDPAARYFVEDRPKPRLVHTGPAMLAAIQRGGRFAGVHMTWIDLAAPKGKARIVDTNGEILPAKKVRGSKRGGHIDLTGTRNPRELILGEGIEKVLAVWSAYAAAGRDVTSVAFWSAVDLGNLGGKARSTVPHPSLKTEKGRAVRVPGPDPDLEAPAIEIPDSVERLVLLGDATSDRFATEQALLRAQNRYARAGRDIVVAWAPDGKDFDDLLREAA